MNLNQKLILALSFGCVILSIYTNDRSDFNPSYGSVQSVLTLNGGARNSSSENTPKISVPQALEQTINRREMLRKHFPDWEERMDYQKKQEAFYKSAIKKQIQLKRLRIQDTSSVYTKEEVDAINYFHGKGLYKYYQSLETPPNIFDTRWSFLLKIEKNKNMRENFLKSYNRRKSEN